MNRFLIQSAATLALASGALAEPPLRPIEARPAQIQPRMERTAYIGIATSIAPAALREQVSLPRGVGLVIEFVDKDSPAERAGLQPHDVIHKFDDQIIVNPAQLTVLVRLRKPGETAKLTIIRKSDPQTVDVVLGEKEQPVFDEATTLIMPPGHQGVLMPRPGVGAASGVITHSDGTHTIVIATHDNNRELTIKDRDGTVIYTGHLNSDKDRERIPPELRDKVAQVERSTDKINELRQEPGVVDRDGPGQ
jgi:membrane-associated protease RseP (regulator of RpoE activity)